MSNLYAHGFWVEPGMPKELRGRDIERIVEKDREQWCWEENMKWLQEGGPYPFVRPVIRDDGTVIWGYCTIHSNAKIGKDCVIGAFTNICGPVEIGDGTRLQGFTFIPQGVKIGKGVFIGPGVMFLNVKYPTARFGKVSRDRLFENISIGDKAAIGGAVIICPGISIGSGALVAAGSVVTQNVMAEWLVKGNPARHIRKIVDLKEEEEQIKTWGIE